MPVPILIFMICFIWFKDCTLLDFDAEDREKILMI